MLSIYLADLEYDVVKTNSAVPLGIGYIAAFLERELGDAVSLRLFKWPSDLERALNEAPPDVLMLSNYSWNSRLSLLFCELGKQANPGMVTVMGGPNIRHEPDDLREFLEANPQLDYHILFEGEEPSAELVRRILAGEARPAPPPSVAALVDGELAYEPVLFRKKSRRLDLPSPYLSGWLDDFLADPQLTPLLESNRGCPFGCAYCAWGVSQLSKVRQRDLDTVFREIEYVADKSAGQMTWIFCDANFGLLPRDVDIARHIRATLDARDMATHVIVWDSKNTGERNIEIASILGHDNGLVAIQSADPEVLKNCGRETIRMADIQAQVRHYKDAGSHVYTNVILGLPGESAASHLFSLKAAFDMGFDSIVAVNIRLLPGSTYESREYRERFKVRTKYRPIYGSYGEYGGRRVFDFEESVRATRDITEDELDGFKVVHWLIYFLWNSGIARPILRFAQHHGINPGDVLYELAQSGHPKLAPLFAEMRRKSMAEWFESPQEIIDNYSEPEKFTELVEGFAKLNFLYIALVWQDREAVRALLGELSGLVRRMAGLDGRDAEDLDRAVEFTRLSVAEDLLAPASSQVREYPGRLAAILLDDPALAGSEAVTVDIHRPEKYVEYCRFYLAKNGKAEYSIQDLLSFLEIQAAVAKLTNKTRVLDQ